MNITLIDIGNIANDGTGDDLRTAFGYINENFVELETSIDASTVAANLGAGVGVFKQKTVNTLEFKSLAVDDKLTVAADGNTITISTNFENKTLRIGGIEVIGDGQGASTTIGQSSINTGTFYGHLSGNVMGSVVSLAPNYFIGTGSIAGYRPEPFSFFLLANQTSNTTTVVLKKALRNGQREIVSSNNVPSVGFFIVSGPTRSKILSVTDNGSTFTVQLQNPISVVENVNYVITEEYLPARVDGVSVRDLSSTINTFDFGNLDGVYTSAIPYLLSQIGLDMGTITSPADVSVDAGTI